MTKTEGQTLKTVGVSWIHLMVESYVRFDKLKSFSATPLPFLVGTEFLLWDFISATFDSLSKVSCTFIVPRCLTMTGYSICCQKIMRRLFNSKYASKIWINKKKYLVKRFYAEFYVSNFYWFKSKKCHVTFSQNFCHSVSCWYL